MADAAVRPLAIRALADRGHAVPADTLAAITAHLKDGTPRTRIESAVALARLNARAAAPALTELLADGDARGACLLLHRVNRRRCRRPQHG